MHIISLLFFPVQSALTTAGFAAVVATCRRGDRSGREGLSESHAQHDHLGQRSGPLEPGRNGSEIFEVPSEHRKS